MNTEHTSSDYTHRFSLTLSSRAIIRIYKKPVNNPCVIRRIKSQGVVFYSENNPKRGGFHQGPGSLELVGALATKPVGVAGKYPYRWSQNLISIICTHAKVNVFKWIF